MPLHNTYYQVLLGIRIPNVLPVKLTVERWHYIFYNFFEPKSLFTNTNKSEINRFLPIESYFLYLYPHGNQWKPLHPVYIYM